MERVRRDALDRSSDEDLCAQAVSLGGGGRLPGRSCRRRATRGASRSTIARGWRRRGNDAPAESVFVDSPPKAVSKVAGPPKSGGLGERHENEFEGLRGFSGLAPSQPVSCFFNVHTATVSTIGPACSNPVYVGAETKRADSPFHDLILSECHTVRAYACRSAPHETTNTEPPARVLESAE